MGFQIPNHTQMPNELLDNLDKIKTLSELKVVLFVCRKTFGWQKFKDRISITQMMKGTGLSKQGAIDGTKQAVEHGYIKTNTTGEPGEERKYYQANLLTPPVQVIDPSSLPSRPTIDTSSNKDTKEKDLICKTSLSNGKVLDSTPQVPAPPPPIAEIRDVYMQSSEVRWRKIGIRTAFNDQVELLLKEGHTKESIIKFIKKNPEVLPWNIKPVKEYIDKKGEILGMRLAPHFDSNGKEIKP